MTEFNEFEPYGKDLFTNIERLKKTISECGDFSNSSAVLFQEDSEGRRSFVYYEISETIIMMLVSMDLLVKDYNMQIGDILNSVIATTDKNCMYRSNSDSISLVFGHRIGDFRTVYRSNSDSLS